MSVKKDTAMSVKKTNQMSVKKNNNEAPKAISPPGIDISEEEKEIIKRQWKVLSSDMKATGTAVFMHIFREQPEIKQQFSYREVDDKSLPMSLELRGHAFRFMQAVGATIENIDDLENTMTEALLTLGKHHVTLTGFKPIYIRTFYSAILKVWQEILGVHYTPKCADAWGRVLTFIMDKLEQGYYMAAKETTSTKNGSD